MEYRSDSTAVPRNMGPLSLCLLLCPLAFASGGAHLLFLLLKELFPVRFLRDLHIRLTLALLVLQWAIQEHNSRILDLAAHSRVRDVLAEASLAEEPPMTLEQLTVCKLGAL